MSQPERSAWRASLPIPLSVVALMATALALRWVHYGRRLPWLDEVETRLYAEGPWLEPLRRALAGPPLSNPPLYFALVKLARGLGLAGAHLRLPSVVCGAAAVPLLFLLGRRLASARVGLVAAALLAISPLHVRYSQEARCYTLLMVEGLLFTLAALAVRSGAGRRARIALVATVALLGFTHYAGAAMAGAGLLAVALWRRERAVFITVVAALLVLAPIAALAMIGSGGLHAVPHALTLDHGLAYAGWFGYQMGAPFQLGIWLIPALAVTGAAVALARRSAEVALVVVIAISPVVVFAAIPSPYVFFIRYALPALPVVLLLAALGIDALATNALGPMRADGQVAALLVCVLVAAPVLRRFYRERSTPYQAFGQLLAHAARVGEPVWFVHRGGDEQPLTFYGPEIRATLAPYVPVPIEVKRLTDVPPADAWRVAWGAPDFLPRPADHALVLPARDQLRRAEFDVLGQGSHFSLIVELPESRRSDLAEISQYALSLMAKVDAD